MMHDACVEAFSVGGRRPLFVLVLAPAGEAEQSLVAQERLVLPPELDASRAAVAASIDVWSRG